jgi:hypothetical protein
MAVVLARLEMQNIRTCPCDELLTIPFGSAVMITTLEVVCTHCDMKSVVVPDTGNQECGRLTLTLRFVCCFL